MSSSFNEEESEVFSASFAMNDIEIKVGILAGQYSCEYQGASGTLYSGSKALYFVGSYFLFDKKLLLPWEIVRQVVKLDHGVLIETAKKGEDPRQYSFLAMHQPGRIWPLLIELHNDAILDRPCLPSRARVDSMEPLLKRRNSDPLQQHQSRPLLDESDFEVEDRAWLDSSKENLFGDGKGQQKKKSNEAPLQSFMEKVAKSSSSLSTLPSPVLGLTLQEVDDKLGELRCSAIPCTYDTVRGHLYAGRKSLYFHGKKYFWDIRKIFVPFHTVKQVKLFHLSPEETKDKSAGIVVMDQFEKSFHFSDMENADKVWAEILEIHNENLKRSRPSLCRGIDNSRHGSLKRMNSDPDLAASRATPEKGRALISPGKFAPELPLQQRDLAHQDTDPSSNQSTKARSTIATAKSQSFDCKAEWNKAVERKKDYPNLVVENLQLPCSMEEFVGHFFADDASYSIPRFLESRGDTSLEASAWVSASPAADHHRTRVVHYKHPVNAPLAPPQAGARKEQTLVRYGDLGLCLESRTIVDVVPMADCFYVDDRIRVQPDGPKSVVINMEFEITFVKSTLFKSIISKTTRSEFTDLFRAMGKYMTEALGGGSPSPVAMARESLRGGATEEVSSVSGTHDAVVKLLQSIHRMITILVLLLQMYLLYELKSMKSLVESQNASSNSCTLDAEFLAQFEKSVKEDAL